MTFKKIIYTIGYEDVTIDRLIVTLTKARITTLLDVRAVPLSRKLGFSKNKLAGFLAEAGIRYVGLKGLGTPAEGRAAARRGEIAKMHSIFKTQLKTPEAMHDMAAAINIATTERSCLLCYENKANDCHRLLVAEAIIRKTKQSIRHLDPLQEVKERL